MRTERFDSTDELLDGGVRVFHLHGRLCSDASCFVFQDRACLAIKDSTGGVVVDLAGISHIDSSGIGILAALVASSRKAGHAVILAAAPPPVERILEAIWFLRIVEHAPTVAEGVGKVRSQSG
ncbi:MAG: STAS domain-containing protein [Acidobacteria bacterium]|nr:STAS domain-containing protein [Acidobacteriota bacterium]